MNRTIPIRAALAAMCVMAAGTGCRRDARLADREVRSVTVRAVTHYGVTLDESASPEQVAYVALRAIRDDFLASDEEERLAALDRQFDVCAADVIQSSNRTGLSRDEFVYNVVYRWTPTVSHYVSDFAMTWEAAKDRFLLNEAPVAQGSDAAPQCAVAMELSDPSGDPNAQVVMVVWLAKDGGFWRVVRLAFDPTRRSLIGLKTAAANNP